MAKVADVKLGWTKSPSSDVDSVEIVVINDGTETTTELGPEVQDFQIVVSASKSVQFSIKTYDSEGNMATSETYSFTLGDLEAPLPATGLFHEVLGVREVDV
jgi:hypothetical protein